MKGFVLVSLVLLGVHVLAEDLNLRGVPKSVRSKYFEALESNHFRCFDGSKVIPKLQFNDDYCDCDDGSDEPGTSACSQSKFWCQNKFHEGRFLPSSRVNDGVCDCCDGTDEYAHSNSCPNSCFELGAEKRKELQDKAAVYKNGINIRASYISRSQTTLESKSLELQNTLNELNSLQDPIISLKSEIEELEKLIEPPHVETPATQPETPQPQESSGNEGADGQAQVDIEALGDESTFEKLNPQINVIDTQAADVEDDVQNELQDSVASKYEQDNEQAPPKERHITFDDMPDDDDNTYDEDDDYYRDGMDSDYDDDFQDFGDDTPEVEEPKNTAEEPQAGDVPTNVSELTPLEQKRRQLQGLESRRSDLEVTRDRLQKILNKDYGPEKGFFELHERCFDLVTNQYTYSVCPYKQATQQGDSTANLGRSFSFEDNYSKMAFRQGDGCWQGPQRSMTVTLVCGAKEEVQRVEEPERCVYTSIMTTPMACSPAELKQLEAELQKALNPEDE
eukprot:TRINITY_DN1030_c0_g1_i1.p1 TRINITY_DN1030_c0_g1~~TRINITY_DN1030_c0_g1_i1.p1  ORF type:complete len:507 (-),score=109.10 TRINITY_DN1030_c0_g1_i1:321-1841(-)